MTLTPSYQQGFAPRDYEPLYPQLWSGCVGAWAPCLGATGTVLRDHSGYGNHGTLTNMDPPNDWVVSGGKGALDFDGSDDRVVATRGVPSFDTKPFTVSGWGRNTNGQNGNRHIIVTNYDGSSDGGGQYFVLRFGDVDFYRANFITGKDNNSQSVLGTTNLNDALWHSLVGVRNENGLYIYVDGKLENSSLGPLKNATNTSQVSIGALPFGGGAIQYFPGQLDDIRIYNRALTESEIRLLASERGIAYKQRRKKIFRVSAATTNAAWLSGRNVLITPGIK